jgi:hypothetical protein
MLLTHAAHVRRIGCFPSVWCAVVRLLACRFPSRSPSTTAFPEVEHQILSLALDPKALQCCYICYDRAWASIASISENHTIKVMYVTLAWLSCVRSCDETDTCSASTRRDWRNPLGSAPTLPAGLTFATKHPRRPHNEKVVG